MAFKRHINKHQKLKTHPIRNCTKRSNNAESGRAIMLVSCRFQCLDENSLPREPNPIAIKCPVIVRKGDKFDAIIMFHGNVLL